MKRFLLPLFMTIVVTGFTQTGDSMKKGQVIPVLTDTSIVARLEKLKDSIFNSPRFDSIQTRENIDRNVSGIIEMQKVQRAREKKAAMIRIGIGVALLVVLIIGLRRKSVKK